VERAQKPLKEGGTTGNAQIDQRLKEASQQRRNPESANIDNNFQGGKTMREHRDRWPVDE
jgi:hypothetical protein